MSDAHKSTIFTKAFAIAVIGTPVLLYLQFRGGGDRSSTPFPAGSLQVTRTAGYACPTRDLLDRAASDGAAALASNGGSCFIMPSGVEVRIAGADPTVVKFQLANSPNGGVMWARARIFSR